MSALRHVMILASAGSGKTYALTNRFVELLVAGAAPERIVALTFTRKAAGEFFDEILHKLARAAREDAFARQLATEFQMPHLRRSDFLRLLRAMVDAMPRLKLGTLDSFFARIARAFPLELGLMGDFEVLQEHAARLERQRVLRRMFARANGNLEAAQTEFIEAFKRATFGAEEKRLGTRLDAFLDQHQENFLAAPAADMWGDPRRIWPRGSRWLDGAAVLAEEIGTLRSALGPLTDGQRERWENFFAALAEWSPGSPLAPPIEYILKNGLLVWGELCCGNADMTVDRKKVRLSKPACAALERIIVHIIGAELHRHIETTRGIHAVLRSYEAIYHDTVRRMGRLTFSDVQRLLDPLSGAPPISSHPRGHVATASAEDDAGQLLLLGPGNEVPEPATPAERRLLVDYRLDSEIDHWLLDEFQDTSFGQWSVLRNLIDEVVQDPEGRRTFFCVGDVKQAIYAWREGDPRLFREIFNHYNQAAPGSIAERHLVKSYRSGPALIEMVNAVFGSAATLTELFPGDASSAWNREWRAHESAVSQRTGQAALLWADGEAERWATTRLLLQEIRPLERGLSCAILVKKNDTAAALADYLRHAGIAALAESDLHIATDNPVGAALLALLQAVAHPGDSLAREHLVMTPLGPILRRAGLDTPEALTAHVLRQIHDRGFEHALEYWVEQLEPELSVADAFSRRRAQEFVSAAGLFDATGSRNVDEFIAFMERHTVRPPDTGAVVRVMTVHKSKGLGFDVVVLPDLQGNRIDEPRGGLAVCKAADRSVQWVLDLPARQYCEQDEVLAAFVRQAEASACYENLSLLYVAMTRAKRAMYVITEPVGKSKSRNFPRLLSDTLGDNAIDVTVGSMSFRGAWAAGNPDWHVHVTPPERSADGTRAPSLSPLANDEPARIRRYVARRPSANRAGEIAADTLFALGATSAADFGTALHALLAEVEWADAADASALARRWTDAGHAAAVVSAAASCIGAPTLAGVWQKPADASAEVWRERSFEIVLDGAWVTGVVDRVVVRRNPAGRVVGATVYDFKTDRVSTERDISAGLRRYSDQLSIYRRVVAVLTSLPVDLIACELVFTQVGRAILVQ